MRSSLFCLLSLLVTLVSGCTLLAPPAMLDQQTATPLASSAPDPGARRTVTSVALLGQAQFATGYQFQATEVGGLSAVVYDPALDRYLLLSDDRSERAPARIYVATIDLTDGALLEGDVTFLETIALSGADGNPYASRSIDPEGLARSPDGQLFLTSEGDDTRTTPPIAPFLHEITPAGAFVRALPIPDHYLPTGDGSAGIRNNLAFESLTTTPDGQHIIIATENALLQDGPAADLEQGSLVRILAYDAATGRPAAEYIYLTEPVPEIPDPADAFRTNGLAEVLALDNHGTFLALERAFSVGKGNTIRLYEAQIQNARNVLGEQSLSASAAGTTPALDAPVAKQLVVDFAALGIEPDNLEGMAFGPLLPDGRQTLLVVSDNNFSATQTTQFIALALSVETLPLALPTPEP